MVRSERLVGLSLPAAAIQFAYPTFWQLSFAQGFSNLEHFCEPVVIATQNGDCSRSDIGRNLLLRRLRVLIFEAMRYRQATINFGEHEMLSMKNSDLHIPIGAIGACQQASIVLTYMIAHIYCGTVT